MLLLTSLIAVRCCCFGCCCCCCCHSPRVSWYRNAISPLSQAGSATSVGANEPLCCLQLPPAAAFVAHTQCCSSLCSVSQAISRHLGRSIFCIILSLVSRPRVVPAAAAACVGFLKVEVQVSLQARVQQHAAQNTSPAAAMAVAETRTVPGKVCAALCAKYPNDIVELNDTN